ncbi:MAG: methyltransferase domain-containing protein [Beijerinckiaceae bacterium]|nr:methyltransferase domain-containing protein [Beijerinckiaceae bacterium]
MIIDRQNFVLKEEIREYWTRRAETFDQSPFHGMRAPGEKEAWMKLIGSHVDRQEGADVLELAFGTGEITAVLLALGYRVTGLDLVESMLARAKAKHATAKSLSLYLGDAEDTREPHASHDAIVMRHLVWTLVDQAAAFSDWFRVVRPGGRIVVIDGNFVEKSLIKRLRRRLSTFLERLQGTSAHYIDWAAHNSILSRVYFNTGLTPEHLRKMLQNAGFEDFRIDNLEPVRSVQRRKARLSDRLKLGLSESFILSCRKPNA